MSFGQLPLRGKKLAIYGSALSVVFAVPLGQLFWFALRDEMFSYILLIPLISGYLAHLRSGSLSEPSEPCWVLALLCGLTGLVAASLGFGHFWPVPKAASIADGLALPVLAYVFFIWAGACVFLGKQWMRLLLFPAAMLVFLVPFPMAMLNGIEIFYQRLSADATQLLFDLAGTTYARYGQIFELPSTPLMSIQVAQECSGVRSSVVLFLTSLIAGHLFLRTVPAKLFLAVFVIPLGILRNGFRIFVISQLCINVDTGMIHSPIHHRGGPIFFVLSLIPFFAVLAGLRWWEKRRGSADTRQTTMVR